MRPQLRDLPGAVLCLALALSRGDRYEALQVAQFIRGLAIQAAFRFAADEILVNGGSGTLLYSRLDGPRAGPRRSLVGLVAAVAIGLALFVVANLLLMLPLGIGMRALGAGPGAIALVGAAIAGVRLICTAWRAGGSYRLERSRERLMPRLGDMPRWRLDLMGTNPSGAGHGAALLREFVRRSDAAGATVYLATEPCNERFYRRGGFRVVTADDDAFRGMLLMRRIAPTSARSRPSVTSGERRASPVRAPADRS